LHFYRNLETIDRKLHEVLADENNFRQFPAGWQIIVADIANSTQAVEAGRHDDVNLIAAGSLIAALNVTKIHTEVPYFFGGDGGTVIVPGDIANKVLEGLSAHKINTLNNFGLDLRIGSMPIDDIIKAGYEIKVAKILIGKGYTKSVIIGDGLKYAEMVIKGKYPELEDAVKTGQDLTPGELNMEGLECRWDRIKPPANQLEVVCLLIESVKRDDQLKVYRDALVKLDEIYGEIEKRHPVTVKALKLLNTFKKLQKEMMVRYSKTNLWYLIKIFFSTFIGKFYFKYNFKVNDLRGRVYLEQLVAFSDILTIDGRINTIVSGTREQRLQLLDYLKQQEEKKLLIYGHHVSPESIMTCYIENMKDKHIHFVDGSNGGYTEAAKELKVKMKSLIP